MDYLAGNVQLVIAIFESMNMKESLKMYLYMNILNYLYLMEPIQSQNKIGV